MAQQCTMCSSNASSGRCGSCNCSAYCSKECQKADWPIHKLLCKQFQNFATPPNASSRRGIYLPVDKVNPEFVWVPTERVPQVFERLKFKPYIGMDLRDNVWVWGNAIRSREREDLIQLIMRDTALVDGSLPNRTIAGLTKGVAFYSWCGSMLAMKVATLKVDSGRYLHMDTVDFRDLVDLLCSYGSSVGISNMSLNRKHKGPQSPLENALKKEADGVKHKGPQSPLENALKKEADGVGPSLANRFHHMNFDLPVPGVRINCSSDLSARGNQMFEAVKVTSKDPRWNAPITSISILIGMPVKVRRIKPVSDSVETNQAATFLHLNADPQSEFWGWAYPWDWQTGAGSCLVVHAERKKLSPREVEILCSFCQDFLQPLFEDSVENSGNMKLKNAVLRHLTPSSYTQFCSDFESGRRTYEDDTTE